MSSNDIILRDPSVSKTHAYFTVDPDGGVHLHVKETANGTFVNGEQIRASGAEGMLVTDGAILGFGNTVCEFIAYQRLFRLLFS